MNFPCLCCQSSVTGMLCVRARGSVPVWIRGNLHWVGYAVLSQSTHPCLSAANPVYVCVCMYVSVYVYMYVCVRARYKWLAGQPLAMNITEHSLPKFKLTGGRFPQSTFSCLCVCVCVCVGGECPLFLFYLFYFLLCTFRTRLFRVRTPVRLLMLRDEL